MILRRQADPGGELSPRSEQLGRRGLHLQQSRADRADTGDLGEASAAVIGLVPGRELGVDRVDLRLLLLIFRGLDREQLTRQGWQARVSLDAPEQRIEVGSPGGGQAELGRIAADGVRQLRAIADQPIADPDSIRAACCSAVFTGTNRIVGRLIASHSASASAASFLPRFTYGLTS
jgi:hypothetical protein